MSTEVINIEEALERIGGEKEFLFELLHEFAQQIEEMMPSLEEAIRNSDYDNIKLIAHSLRGAAGNLSINGMYKALSEIEKLAIGLKSNEMTVFIERVNEENSNFKKFLKDKS